jgi:hypothetical protein
MGAEPAAAVEAFAMAHGLAADPAALQPMLDHFCSGPSGKRCAHGVVEALPLSVQGVGNLSVAVGQFVDDAVEAFGAEHALAAGPMRVRDPRLCTRPSARSQESGSQLLSQRTARSHANPARPDLQEILDMLCATGRKACRPEPFGGRAVGAAAGEGGGGGGGGGAGAEGVGRAAREDQYMAAGGGGGGAGAGVPIVQDAEVQVVVDDSGYAYEDEDEDEVIDLGG